MCCNMTHSIYYKHSKCIKKSTRALLSAIDDTTQQSLSIISSEHIRLHANRPCAVKRKCYGDNIVIAHMRLNDRWRRMCKLLQTQLPFNTERERERENDGVNGFQLSTTTYSVSVIFLFFFVYLFIDSKWIREIKSDQVMMTHEINVEIVSMPEIITKKRTKIVNFVERMHDIDGDRIHACVVPDTHKHTLGCAYISS